MSIRASCSLSNESHNITGNIIFTQEGENTKITGKILHLLEGTFSINIHEFGDISNGWLSVIPSFLNTGLTSTGNHFNPHNKAHGLFTDKIRHAGDLGVFQADSEGTANISIEDDLLVKLNGPTSIIGRSLVISKEMSENDNEDEGHEMKQVAFGVIGIIK